MAPGQTISTAKYTPLEASESSSISRPRLRIFNWPLTISGWSAIPSILSITLALLTAFYIGSQSNLHTSSISRSSIDDPINLTVTPRTFIYNSSFATPPSPSSDAAWSSLFPRRGGYFTHPTLAPERSAFSVFHQLHCLDGLRHGYWILHDAATTGKKIESEHLPFMASEVHLRHCVDLLRQSLMCRPDLTVEVKDVALGGVTGFGTEHRCRDWGELVRWVGKWEGDSETESGR